MEKNSAERKELGQEEEHVSRVLRRKAELLSAVFGLPKPDVAVTSIENMPEEFNLPKEMVSVFKEIWAKPDSDKIEYGTLGDIRKGKLFFGEIKRGGEKGSQPSVKDSLLEVFSLRRIRAHSHYSQEYDLRFSGGGYCQLSSIPHRSGHCAW